MDDERLRQLIAVGRALVAELDTDTVLERLLAAARDVTGARYAALGVLGPDRDELEHFHVAGVDPDMERRIGELPRGHGVLGVLIEEPKVLRLDDIGSHPSSFGFPPGHPPMHTFLGAPIVIRGEAWGNIYLTEKDGGFDAQDEDSLTILAGWAAIAIRNARVHGATRGRRDELERSLTAFKATSEIAQVLAGETRMERVAELIVKRARAVVDARATVLYLAEGEELVVIDAAGEVDRSVVGRRVARQDSIAGRVLADGVAQRYEDLPAALRFHLRDHVSASTGLFIPLIFRGRRHGVLAAFDVTAEHRRDLAEADRTLKMFAATAASALSTIADQRARSLERSLAAAERERQRWARELHDQTLQDMAGIRLMLGAARQSDDLPTVRAAVETAMRELEAGVAALRNIIVDLRPASLDEFGTRAAIEALVTRLRERSGVEIAAHVDLAFEEGRTQARHSPELEATIYRLVQEAVTNALKHAVAAHVAVDVAEDDTHVVVTVRDDGAGFDTTSAGDGFGLIGMRERVELAGGSLEVRSRPGDGTTIHAALPVFRRAAEAGLQRGRPDDALPAAHAG